MAGPVTELRDRQAKVEAIARYQQDYERFAESAQMYVGTDLFRTIADVAVLFLLAADAEMNDPEPRKVADCICASCRLYRMGLR
jgi:hypothetical protein